MAQRAARLQTDGECDEVRRDVDLVDAQAHEMRRSCLDRRNKGTSIVDWRTAWAALCCFKSTAARTINCIPDPPAMEFTAIRDDGHQVVTFTPTVILCVILRIRDDNCQRPC